MSSTSSEQLETVQLKFGSLQGKDLIKLCAKPVLFVKYLYFMKVYLRV